MLIKALCDYYDILAKAGKILPDGYSNVKIHYQICLTPDGKIDEIIDCQDWKQIKNAKGRVREKKEPLIAVFPKRTEKSAIEANVIEHRSLYIFGLNYDQKTGSFLPNDRTGRAKKSHEALVKTNLEFLEELDSPVVNAYRAFLQSWVPEEERQNEKLLALGKGYDGSGFSFVLSGQPHKPLQEDEGVKEKWDRLSSEVGKEEDMKAAQCAVCGERAPIARIHNKIKGIKGGLSTGTVLIGFNNASENSYGNDQSYNSNISETVMKQYSEALNYLLSDHSHTALLADVTILFWAMNAHETETDMMSALFFGENQGMSAEETQDMLKRLFRDSEQGSIASERIASVKEIDPNVDFYILGLKPNASRLAMKFLYRKKYGEILQNVAKHQRDLQISKELWPVPFWKIKSALLSPKSKNDEANPALLSKLFEAVLYGTNYPASLLEQMVRRVKTDAGSKVDKVHAGVIKACINRGMRAAGKKEELTVALDRENGNQAYLCGRLFAVLERVQQDASGNSLNRTIKDAYFASASSKPALVFPKLLRLAQNHLNKAKSAKYYTILIGEIIDKLQGEFPDTLLLTDQGRFIVGYYQQYQSFFVKNETKEREEETKPE